MTIALSTRRDEDLVRIGGVIDFVSAPYVRQVVLRLYDEDRRHITVDLCGVQLIDAAAVRVLVFLHGRAEQHGGWLRAVGARGVVLTALELTGAAKSLRAYDDLDWPAAERSGEPVDLDAIRLGGGQWPPGVTAQLVRLHTDPADRGGRGHLRDTIVESCLPTARRLARRFARASEPVADLEQVAYLGLLKAVDGFDPGRAVEFGPYANSTILGELKRYFRDQLWTVRVPRHLQERWLVVCQTRDEVTQLNGRSPTIGDIAGRAGLTEDEVREVVDLDHSRRPLSLDLPVSAGDGDLTMLDRLGDEDPELSGIDYRHSLRVLLPRLPQRTQRVLAMRFYGGLTQQEIADEIGVSQMQVSRILRQSLTTLRRCLEEIPP